VNAAALPNVLYQPMGPSMFGSPSPLLYPSLAMLQPTMLPAPLTTMATQGAADRVSSTPLKNSSSMDKINAYNQYKNLQVCF
jgi:hypothetical protein